MGETLYKVLGPNGESIHGGTGTWHLPNGKPGKWMPRVGDPECCERGYHLVEWRALPGWLAANCTIYEAEGKGKPHADGSGKAAYPQARLIRRLYLSEKVLRLFAADCAERVLPIWEKHYPDDDRPRKAIEATRRFARGEIGAAAGDAAAAAARAAARAAAICLMMSSYLRGASFSSSARCCFHSAAEPVVACPRVFSPAGIST